MMIGLTVAGHQSLRRLTGIIQCDISIGNLMMNEEIGNPSQEAFLIDLDLAFKEARDEWSCAPSKTGTKIFMAIGALHGDPHSFMHDLESFFWVLFWMCIHYTGPNCPGRVVKEFVRLIREEE
jgi:Fungal protein kinase